MAWIMASDKSTLIDCDYIQLEKNPKDINGSSRIIMGRNGRYGENRCWQLGVFSTKEIAQKELDFLYVNIKNNGSHIVRTEEELKKFL